MKRKRSYYLQTVETLSSLRGLETVDDPDLVSAGYDTETIWDGLGIIPHAIVPHYKSDHSESADVDKEVAYMIDNHIPFIAVHDGEAIVIDGDHQAVV